MREELHLYLDGETARTDLPSDLREEAAAWEAFLDDLRAAGPSTAPAGLRSRVVEAVLSGRGEPWWKRAAAWWIRPWPVRIRPLAAVAAAAAVVLAFLVAPIDSRRGEPREAAGEGRPPELGGPAPAAARAPRQETIYVQFLMRAPAARSVAVAGDFNGWTPNIVLQDPDGDGIWSARVPVTPGVHEYMFVIDGSDWVTDPYAERYAEDGFGNRNAVLAVATSSGS